jgi:alginate O-acetyltransferase complex protein AlgI
VIFSSTEFLLFLTAVLLLTRALRSEDHRRNVLLVASYFFYGWWDWRFTFLMFTTTTIDYVVGLHLERMTHPGRRRALLFASLAANLGILFYFKYANFFLGSLKPLLEAAGLHVPHLEVVLPAGISFFTFQSMSYTIDVYRRDLPATRSFRDFVLFVSFFPQLVAGPIVRASVFMPQLRAHDHRPRWDNVRHGLERFLRGFVKKTLIADTLAQCVDPVFAHPGAFASPSVWLAVLAYTGQIYYDFSGYTDMATGCGRMFGFEFPPNFRHPYLSRSITEFWRRWHMTLSTWLRDYLYIPLGGNRLGRGRTYLNLAATMLLGGLWHGASWTFVAWGAWHGAGLALDKLRMELGGRRTGDPAPVWESLLGWAGTFLFVIVGWVFFRSQDFVTATVVLRKMAFLEPAGSHWFRVQAAVVLVAAVGLHLAVLWRRERELLLDLRQPLAWTAAVIALLLVILFSPFSTNPFIYFQF